MLTLTHFVMELEVTECSHRESPGVCPGFSIKNAVDDVKAPHPSAWTNDPVEKPNLDDSIQHHGNLHSEVVTAHACSWLPELYAHME